MSNALVLIPLSLDDEYDQTLAYAAATKIVELAGHDVVEAEVPFYASDEKIMKILTEAVEDADLLVLTPSADADVYGAELKQVAKRSGTRVRNIRKIALEVSGGRIDPQGEMADLLRACGHVISDNGWVETAYRSGVLLSDAQADASVLLGDDDKIFSDDDPEVEDLKSFLLHAGTFPVPHPLSIIFSLIETLGGEKETKDTDQAPDGRFFGPGENVAWKDKSEQEDGDKDTESTKDECAGGDIMNLIIGALATGSAEVIREGNRVTVRVPREG